MVNQMLLALFALSAGVAHLTFAAELLDLGRYGKIEADTRGIRKLCALEFDLYNDFFNHMIEDNEHEIWDDIQMLSKIRISNNFDCSSYVIKFFGPPGRAYEWKANYVVFARKCHLEDQAKIYCEESSEALEALADPNKAAKYKELMCNYYETKSAARKRLGGELKIAACKTDESWNTKRDTREEIKKNGLEGVVAMIREQYPEDEPKLSPEEMEKVRDGLAKLKMDIIEKRLKQMTLKGRLMDRFSVLDTSSPLPAADHVCDQLEDKMSIERCKKQIKKYWRFDPN